jgi:hypothetical protein
MQADIAEQIIKRALRKWLVRRRAFQEEMAAYNTYEKRSCCDNCGCSTYGSNYVDVGFCSKTCLWEYDQMGYGNY